jgi:glycosyltransferase involved in cell wall biosynthesis
MTDERFSLQLDSANIVPVSVIIPCFCCANTIGRAIDSVLRQTSIPAEVILVDDCSGDDTARILRNLEEEHRGWVKILTLNINGGPACARNAGWNAASYPYLAFLDADDSWHPEKVRIQYEFMQGNTGVAISGHLCISLADGGIPPKIPLTPEVTKISATSLIFKSSFSTPTVMLKRDIPFRFTQNKRYCEDIFLWQQIAFARLPVMRIESTLAYVHKALYGEGGMSAQLWEMEKGELSNIVALYHAKSINSFLFVAATVFSIVKYFKRLVVTWTKPCGNVSFS